MERKSFKVLESEVVIGRLRVLDRRIFVYMYGGGVGGRVCCVFICMCGCVRKGGMIRRK